MKKFKILENIDNKLIDMNNIGSFPIRLLLGWLLSSTILPICSTAIFIFCVPIYIVNLIWYPINIFIFKYYKTKKQKEEIKRVKKILYIHQEGLLVNNEYYKLRYFNSGERKQSLDKFIKNFLFIYNDNYITVDKDDKYICSLNRRRSLGDIFLICRGYYPNCTIDNVL